MFLTTNQFNFEKYWKNPIHLENPTRYYVDLFDQNGYDLTELEKLYALANDTPYSSHREHRFSLKKPWITQSYIHEGAILNHCYLFERKGYSGKALQQLQEWAKKDPIFYKIINIRPKWGIDFSMDYCGNNGETFEVLHYEYDSFDFDEIQFVKSTLEKRFLEIDWNHSALELLKRKSEWHSLDFFSQSDWKCNFFDIPKERFKMVTWK